MPNPISRNPYPTRQYQQKAEPTPVYYFPSGNNLLRAFTVATALIFPKTIIYQDVAECPQQTAPEVVTVDKWFSPFSEPKVKTKPRTAEYTASFYGASPIVSTVDRWWQNFSVPVKLTKPRTPWYLYQIRMDTDPAVAGPDSWWRNFDNPTLRKPLIGEENSYFSSTYTAENITVDKWFNPFVEVARKKPLIGEELFGFVPPDQPEAEDQMAWWRDLSTPPKSKSRAAEYPYFTYGATPIVNTADQWAQPWSLPQKLTRPRAVDFPAFVSDTDPIVPFPDSWWRNFDPPPKARARTPWYQYFSTDRDPTVPGPDNWHRPFSEPVRKPRATEFPAAFYGYAAQEEVTLDKYFNPLSEPRRFARRAAEYPYLAFSSTQPEADDQIAWHRPFSEPRKLFRDRAVDYNAAFTPPYQLTPSDFNAGWYRDLSQPYPYKRGLGTYQQQSSQYIAGAVLEEVTLDKWYRPLGEPRKLSKERAAEYPAFAYGPTPIVNTADQWAQPWSLPQRLSKLRAVDFPAFTADPTPKVPSSDAWWRNFDNPVLRKPLIGEEAFQFAWPDQPEARDDFAWWRDFGTPTLRKPLIGEEAFQFAWPDQPDQSDQIAWHRPFSEPKRIRQPIHQSTFDAYFVTPEVKVDGWYIPLSTPKTLSKPRTAEYTAFVAGPTQPQANDQIGWYRPLNEPRKLSRDRAAEYPAYFAPLYLTTPSDYLAGWWRPLAEPYPYKRALGTHHQQFAIFVCGSELETVTMDKWYRPYVDPQKLAKARATEFPAVFYGAAPIVNTADQWWQNLATPPKAKARAPWYQPTADFPIQPQAGDQIGWYLPFTNPVKLSKPRAAEYPALAYAAVNFQARDNIGWFSPFSTPQKLYKPRDAWFQFTANFPIQPQAKDQIAWQVPWLQPKRNFGQRYYEQQSFGYTNFVEVVTMDKWWSPFTQPKRYAFGQKVWEQKADFYTVQDFVRVTVIARGYIIC